MAFCLVLLLYTMHEVFFVMIKMENSSVYFCKLMLTVLIFLNTVLKTRLQIWLGKTG